MSATTIEPEVSPADGRLIRIIPLEDNDVPLPFVTTITGPLVELYQAKSLVSDAMTALIDGANDECRARIQELEELIAPLKRKVPL